MENTLKIPCKKEILKAPRKYWEFLCILEVRMVFLMILDSKSRSYKMKNSSTKDKNNFYMINYTQNISKIK